MSRRLERLELITISRQSADTSDDDEQRHSLGIRVRFQQHSAQFKMPFRNSAIVNAVLLHSIYFAGTITYYRYEYGNGTAIITNMLHSISSRYGVESSAPLTGTATATVSR
eukprot:scaffold74073_cov53-Prasinocladus_malaysianus.AAC.1